MTDETARVLEGARARHAAEPCSAGATPQRVAGATPQRVVFLNEAGSEPAPFSLRDLWRCLEMLYFMTWRDIKVRYKQTAMGAAWAIIQPLFLGA